MSFRKVQVHEFREVLRLWLHGEGLRSIERPTGWTARRSVAIWPPGWRWDWPATGKLLEVIRHPSPVHRLGRARVAQDPQADRDRSGRWQLLASVPLTSHFLYGLSPKSAPLQPVSDLFVSKSVSTATAEEAPRGGHTKVSKNRLACGICLAPAVLHSCSGRLSRRHGRTEDADCDGYAPTSDSVCHRG
jgi:hypothetical protein